MIGLQRLLLLLLPTDDGEETSDGTLSKMGSGRWRSQDGGEKRGMKKLLERAETTMVFNDAVSSSHYCSLLMRLFLV